MLTVSSLYVWFMNDFGGSDKAVIAHLQHYAEPSLAAELIGLDWIGQYRYDWRLNDAAAMTP